MNEKYKEKTGNQKASFKQEASIVLSPKGQQNLVNLLNSSPKSTKEMMELRQKPSLKIKN